MQEEVLTTATNTEEKVACSEHYTFIHSHRRIKVSKDNEGEILQLYIDDKKHDQGSGMTSAEITKLADEKKRVYYKEFLKKQFKNLLVLSGAGSSIRIGQGEKVGLSMDELWTAAEKELGSKVFKSLCEYVACDISKPNLETLLSLLEGYIKYSKKSGTEGVDLIDCKTKLLKLIKDKCSVVAPDDESQFPHVQFLSKITQRKATLPRVKVFTLNYDLLFEQAATKAGAVMLDGFSFISPRTFSGRFFDYDIVQREKSRLKDEDNFISRLFHLYKLHGSLNWERDPNNKDRILISDNPADPLMVYPRESKYENSYEQPFFEMMARFHQNLRLDNTLLLCIGYSFNDKHINAAIFESLSQNPGFQIVIVNPNFDDGKNLNFKLLVEEAKKSERIVIIDEKFIDFAVHFPEIQTYNYESEIPPISL